MSTEDRIERARLACQRAVFVGDVDALDAAERELNMVEADLALARGRIMQARSHERRTENPDELALFQRATELYQGLGDVRGEGEALFWAAAFSASAGNGKLKRRSSSRASSSVFAVVVMMMSMPRTLSIWS